MDENNTMPQEGTTPEAAPEAMPEAAPATEESSEEAPATEGGESAM